MICSSYLEGLPLEDAFIAVDTQHMAVAAIMCPDSESNPPGAAAAADLAASQGAAASKYQDLATKVLQRMYKRQLERQQAEDDMARIEETTAVEEGDADEPRAKKAKAIACSSSIIIAVSW